MKVISEPGFASTTENKTVILEIDIPVVDLIEIGSLMFRPCRPDAKCVPRCHEEEGRADNRDIQPEPSSEEGRRQVLGELGVLTGMNEC